MSLKVIDKEYEQYIRFYLDSVIIPKKFNKDKTYYYSNPNRKFVSYIQDFAGNKNYLFSYPLSVTWNLTSACNLRCVHCLYKEIGYNNENDLTNEQALALADELINDFGITYIIFTGGEIFLRKDIIDIIRRFKENNIGIRLLTNGALLNDEQINEISELFNPYTDSMNISLDAFTDETFIKIRGKDLLKKITGNIKKLTDKKVRVNAVCTVNKINYSEVLDIYNLSKDLGVYGFIAGKAVPYDKSHYSLIADNKDLFKLYYNIMKNEISDGPVLTANFWTPSELLNFPEVKNIIEEKHYQNLIKKYHKQVKSFSCQYHDKITIQSDGTIYLCLEALANNIAPLGNYKKNSLKEIWENRWDNMLFKPANTENSPCKHCKYNTYCNSGCMVKNYLKTKDIEKLHNPVCLVNIH